MPSSAEDATATRRGLVQVPSECPDCGGPVEFGTTEDNESIILCEGDCGNWGYVDDV